MISPVVKYTLSESERLAIIERYGKPKVNLSERQKITKNWSWRRLTKEQYFVLKQAGHTDEYIQRHFLFASVDKMKQFRRELGL